VTAEHDLGPLVGGWRLVSVEATFTDTGERVATFGSAPSGRVVVTEGGRILFLITKSNRVSPADDAARAALFNETIAYSGTVRMAGPGEFVTMVEISLFPEEVGTEKRRIFAIDGDRLIITRPQQTSRVSQGRPVVSELVWMREHPARAD
jgi:Lipocalin-like domain